MNRVLLTRAFRWVQTTRRSSSLAMPPGGGGSPGGPAMEVEVKTAAAFYRTLVENSRGITMVGGFTFAVGGIVAFSVQSRDASEHNKALIEHNKALVAKDVEILESKLEAQKRQTEDASEHNKALVAKDLEALKRQTEDAIEHNKALVAKDLEALKQQTELASLKNLLLFGQSEEYKSMRQSFSSREIVGVAADKKD